MCSRGLRIFFRTRNQVSDRETRYRLTAIIFEAALYTMAFSVVSVTEAYSMTGEPPPSNLCPTAAPQDPDRADPRQANDRGTTRNPPLPSQPATLHGNGGGASPSPTSARARARARTPTQLAQTPRHDATLLTIVGLELAGTVA